MGFVTVDPQNPSTVYAGATAVLAGTGVASVTTVFKSTDSAGTWTAQSNGFGGINATISTIAVDPTNSSNVYASTLGDTDAFLIKLDPSGASEIFGTYFGSARIDFASGVVVDAGGNAYISGGAGGAGFPTTGGAFQTTLKGSQDLFVAKFSGAGALVYSTLIGGNELDSTGGGIALDSAGSVFATGFTFANDFPTTPGAFQRTIGNPGSRAADIFITKVNATGTGLDYSSYLGGDGSDYFNNFTGDRLALDAAENAYVVGVTASTNFPNFDWANPGGPSATHTFVAKISTATPTFSITGRVTNSLSAGVPGIFVQAAETNNGSIIRLGKTDANGYYAIINMKPGDYVVTPQRYAADGFSHYTYAPASRSFPGFNTDQTANFVATQTFDIQGTITHGSIPSLAIFDVTVTLSGGASASTVTDVFGNFVLRDLLPGNYTVTPSKPGFTFNPVNRVFNSLNADQFTTFTTTSGTYVTVSGRAADGSNAAIANATIAMQVAPQIGTREAVTQTDANGNYSFTNLQTGGNYSFVAIKPLIQFAPQQQNYTPLTSNQTLNFTGSASVAGLIGKIAFVRSAASEDIAVMNADGSAETIVTSTDQCSGDSGPAWSPDGSRLAFSRCNNADFNPNLYLVNADGSGLTALQADPERAETFPAWAPEGTRLTYTLGECSGTDVMIPEIFAIDATGALRTQLTSNSVVDAASDWSPNGSSILFTKGANASCSGTDVAGDLYTIDAVGGNERRLTNTPDIEFFGTYSPDGTRIAYARSNQNLPGVPFSDVIVVMNADGSSPTQITPNVISADRPTWSPDGTRIAFAGFIRGGSAPEQIFVVNVDGTGLTEITSSSSISRVTPSWQHFSISGKVTGNTNGLPVTVTLAGTLTRVAKTDAAGNYIFGNLTPGGNYTVTPTSTSFAFTPVKIDVNNLIGNQTANFAVVPAAIPAPSPPLADDFGAGTRDPDKWNLGTQTQPLGAFDPQVTVVQQSGQLIVTPRSQADGLHYNGYVAVNSFDFNSAKATVELVQPAINGAETIFAIGSDLDNYSRFVVRAGGGSSAPGKGRAPKGVGVAQLIFQVRVGGNLTSISIPYDSNLHRFMRFRHEPPTNSIVFETSPDNVNFTVRHSVVLQKSVSALTAELSAGTSTATNPGTAVFDNFNLVTNTFQFAVTAVTANESANRAIVTVTRSGDTSTAASVDYATFDDTARQRTRYVPAVGTLSFAAGQTSRTFSVLLEDNALVEGSQALSLRLIDSSGGGLNSPGKAVLTVDDNDTPPITTNPIDTAQFFVRQHYYDFLSRNPDPGGLNFWTGEITQCGSDQACINRKRIDVSNAFYFELEFQQTGSYVYRLYRVAYGNNQPSPNPRPDANYPNEDKKLLSYNSFVNDRARVIGGSDLAQSQLNLANLLIKRPEFLATYPLGLDGPGFVDAVLHKMQTDIGVDLNSQRAGLISLFNSGGRGAVIYRLADDNINTNPINNRAFIDAEYNRAFVATQYFGYLRRNADIAGFIFWLGQVNSGPLRDVDKQHAMVCSFVTSQEYQERFSLAVTHNNAECPH
jgi:Tol biopolymer transport system component